MYDAFREDRLDEYLMSFSVTDGALERGLADGTLAVDTRLRDALRALRPSADGNARTFAVPGRPLTFDRPATDDDGLYAGEASVLVEIDGIVRAEDRVVALEQRLAELERAAAPPAGCGQEAA